MPQDAALEILLVDDNAGDVRMIVEGLKDALPAARLSVARDGDEAIRFLHRQPGYETSTRPDLILLDLRLPKKTGFDVLKDIKHDPSLMKIPVMVRSSSETAADVDKAYGLHANGYMIKPTDLEEFGRTMEVLADFWATVVKLPQGERHGECRS